MLPKNYRESEAAGGITNLIPHFQIGGKGDAQEWVIAGKITIFFQKCLICLTDWLTSSSSHRLELKIPRELAFQDIFREGESKILATEGIGWLFSLAFAIHL